VNDDLLPVPPNPHPVATEGAINIHLATDGRDILMNTPDGWEVDQPWLWWDGPADGDGTGGPWGNPPPGAEFGTPTWHGTSLPAVSKCLQLTADKLAGLPWHVFRGRDIQPTPLWITDPQGLARDGRRVMLDNPKIRLSAFDFWSSYLRSLILLGEGIAWTPRVEDAYGNPTGPIVGPCHVLNPNHLELIDGEWYVVEPGVPSEEWVHIDDRELVITRWVMRPGKKRGVGIVGAHARDLAAGANTRAYADNLLQRGVPNGYLKSSKPDLTQAQANELKAAWLKAHGSTRKSIGVLNATTEFHAISLDPKAMQYSELRRLSAWDICLMFGVPPSRLGISMGASNTYANLESDNAVYVQDALMPIAARLEAAIDATLPQGTTLKVEFGGLLRGDTKTRYEAYQVALGAGFMTIDEVRALEDLPPLPPAATLADSPVAPATLTPVPVAAAAADAVDADDVAAVAS
jgi:HK97 family phage portal protein